MPTAICPVPNGIMPPAISGTISRPNRQVCDRRYGGLTAKRQTTFAAGARGRKWPIAAFAAVQKSVRCGCIATAPGSAQGVLGGRYYKGGDRCSNSGSLAMFAAVRRGVHLTGGVFGGK